MLKYVIMKNITVVIIYNYYNYLFQMGHLPTSYMKESEGVDDDTRWPRRRD